MNLSIIYACPVVDDAQALNKTVFMGFTPGVVDLPLAIRTALNGPPHLYSLSNTPDDRAKLKLAGAHHHTILPLNLDLLHTLPIGPQAPIVVVISSRETEPHVDPIVKNLDFPVLHIRPAIALDLVNDRSKLEACIREHLVAVAAYLEKSHSTIAKAIAEALADSAESTEPRKLECHKRDHGVTRSNEAVLEMLGIEYSGFKPLASGDDTTYFNAIKSSSEQVIAERKRLFNNLPAGFESPTCDIILACPGLLVHLWSSSRIRRLAKRKNSDSRPFSELGSDDQIRRSLAFCARQEGYTTLTSDSEFDELKRVPAFTFLVSQWKKEVEAFVSFLTIQAINEVCPVIRLPRSINRARGQLKELGKVFRSSQKGDNKSLHRVARKVVTELEKSTLPHFGTLLQGHNKRVRIVADVPVEWIRFEGIPLMLRHCTTRIFATPGNLFSIQSLQPQLAFIDLDRITVVPIIRSFAANDPIKRVFELCVDQYSRQEGWHLKTQIIDVSNEAEFIDACEAIDSPFLVFDGHGSHPQESQVAGLNIGGKMLDIWSLKGRVRIPPIVILSSCDACAADRSHASAVNGFIAIGATTVLGPSMPVHPVKSGIMVARLFYRLTSVARGWINEQMIPLSWAMIVTSQLRASYVSELVIQLREVKVVTNDDSLRIIEATTNAINQFDPDWFEILREGILQATKWTDEKLSAYFENSFVLTDALLYMQAGLPDKVMFVTNELRSRMESGED